MIALVMTVATFRVGSVGAEDSIGKSATRETLIRISSTKQGSTTQLYIENLQSADVTVTLEMDLENLAPTVQLPLTTTLAGKTKTRLLSLNPIDRSRGWSWTYTYYSTFGTTKAEHDNSYVYVLPYSAGKSFRVSQGFNGEYSHFGSDQFAIDWRMPVGTPIHAARGGLVVGVKSDSNVGGDNSKFDWDANYVLIQHADNTLGQYVHLQKGGSTVKVGQRIEAGDLIGFSGNTGHSTGPHLHFSVFKARDGKHRETIPIRYRTEDDFAITLQEGKAYKAGGSPSFIAAAAPKGSKLPSITQATGSPSDMLAVKGGAELGH